MFSMQVIVFAGIHTEVMAKVLKMDAVLVVPDILQKHVEEHGETRFTEQVCNRKYLQLFVNISLTFVNKLLP